MMGLHGRDTVRMGMRMTLMVEKEIGLSARCWMLGLVDPIQAAPQVGWMVAVCRMKMRCVE